MFELALLLLHNVGLLAFVAVAYGLVLAYLKFIPRQIRIGFVCGAGAIVAMLDPAEVSPGVLVDSRTTLVALAGLFGGPVSAALASSMALAYRLYLGGVGAVPGGAVIGLSALIGVGCNYVFVRGRSVPRGRSIVWLALLSPIASIGVFMLPFEQALSIQAKTFIPLNITRIFGVLFLGFIILNEERRVRAEAEVRRLAFVDQLSNLHNRRSFYTHLEQAWERWLRHKTPFSIIILDIDNFKKINDRFGHLAGDRVIKRLGEALHQEAKSADVPARLGGEEFAVLMPNTTAADAACVAERIRERLSGERLRNDGCELSFTVSVGVSSPGGETPSIETLMSAADEALYRAKSLGRNRVVH